MYFCHPLLALGDICIATDKRGYHIISFLFLDEYICCGYSLEAPHQGAFNNIGLDKSGYKVNIFLICLQKHMLWVYIRSASVRRF